MHLNSQSADGQIEGKLEVKSIKSNRKNRQDQHNEYSRTDSLKCFYFKIRSLTCKTEELRAWISTWNLDIVTMTEIWLKEGQDWQSTF